MPTINMAHFIVSVNKKKPFFRTLFIDIYPGFQATSVGFGTILNSKFNILNSTF